MKFETATNIKKGFGFAAGLCLLLLCGCRQKHKIPSDRAFYYWKSSFTLTPVEILRTQQSDVHQLYVKFFDVIWNKELQKAEPVAEIRFNDSTTHQFKIHPVIFITNECLLKTDSLQIVELSHNIFRLLMGLLEQAHLVTGSEIQFDCDWTSQTKEKYFQLLRIFRSKLNEQSLQECALSATIRLYQYKYRTKTGIPPVAKGSLMCYNMGNLKNPDSENSILEISELRKYLGDKMDYPLPLDIALPLFSWKVLFHHNTFAGLITDLPSEKLKNDGSILQTGNRFTFRKDTLLNGYPFSKGDYLREESLSPRQLSEVAEFIGNKMKNHKTTVILFHLDSAILSTFNNDALETIYHIF